MSAASDLTLLAASAEEVIRVFWASRAPEVIASAVAVPAIDSERCTSAASDLTWLAASVEAATSVLCASRAPAVTASAVEVPAIDSERSTSAASDLTWLAASADAVTSVVCASRAPARTDAAVASPAAESVRSTSADSDLIWEAASDEAATSVVCASRALVRIEFAAPVPTAVRAVSTSADVSFSCAPTSEETVSSACCAVRAPVWMVSLVLTTRLVSERSASSTCDLMPVDSISGARHQVFAGLASAAFDAAGHGFDARAEQVLELRNAGIDVAGDGADPGFDALVDFLEPRRMVSVRWALRPSMVSVTLEMRWSTAAIACAVPSVSDEVSRLSRWSIDWIACAAPSVSDDAACRDGRRWFRSRIWRGYRRSASSDFRRPSTVSSNDLILLSSEVSRLLTRVPSVVSNCSRR